MSVVIDRRLNPKDKTIVNRQRFIERVRHTIKKTVKEQIDSGKISDIESGKVKVKVKGIDEYEFGFDRTKGDKKYVHPGNKEYLKGDKIKKPEGGEGGGSGSEAGEGESTDEFEFILTRDEYADFLFEDLELPDLVKKKIRDVTQLKSTRSGYTNQGNPSQLDVVRSVKNGLGRRIALNRPKKEELMLLEEELFEAERTNDLQKAIELRELINQLTQRQKSIPWIDPIDLRYRFFNKVPQPTTQAVMFCIMDVSGSMGENEKMLSKRFFLLLYLFLKKKYNRVDIVFIKHHETAYEVTEEDFFYSRDSGGTIVSSALVKATEIIKDRYSPSDWNIYTAQCSDGDNFPQDSAAVFQALEQLMPLNQYYAYIEIENSMRGQYLPSQSELWRQYESVKSNYPQMNLKRVTTVSDIWIVFKELFEPKSHK